MSPRCPVTLNGLLVTREPLVKAGVDLSGRAAGGDLLGGAQPARASTYCAGWTADVLTQAGFDAPDDSGAHGSRRHLSGAPGRPGHRGFRPGFRTIPVGGRVLSVVVAGT